MPKISDPRDAFGRLLAADWQNYRRGLVRCRKKLGRKRIYETRVAGRRLEGALALAGILLKDPAWEAKRNRVLEQLFLLGRLRDLQLERGYLRGCGGGSDGRRLRHALRRREHGLRRQVRKGLRRLRLGHAPPRIDRLQRWTQKKWIAGAALLRIQTGAERRRQCELRRFFRRDAISAARTVLAA